MASSPPTIGIYRSPDQNIMITIESVNADSSTISTFYENLNEQYPIKVHSNDDDDNTVVGRYYWVKDERGEPILKAPVSMNFIATYRPNKTEKSPGWEYCIVEAWNGFYTKNETLVLTGTHSHVNNQGEHVTRSLGTVEFTLVK